MGFKVAVVGATGKIGREMLSVLAERNFPCTELVALASPASHNKEISFGDQIIKVERLSDYDFDGTDIVFSAAGSKIASEIHESVRKSGAVMIDNSSFFRMDDEVPLVVPEVNPEDIAKYVNKNLIANPNCSTIELVMALKPLHDNFGIKRVVVSTYQATSGKGKRAMDELYVQTKKIYEVSSHPPTEFPKQIAFNCIPQIDAIMDDGFSREEWKMSVETKKIMHHDILVNATCVRVPVMNGHSQSVNVEFENDFDLDSVLDLLYEFPGLSVNYKLEHGEYMTPVECSKLDEVFVSRVRRDHSVPYGLNMWLVADNLRKGGALNAIQIAEILVDEYL